MSITNDTLDGSWGIDLGGICYREMWELGRLLTELGDKGKISGKQFDLDTLRAGFNSYTGEVFLYDEDGNTTLDKEDEQNG